MESVNASGLKNNPTEALRKAQHDVVMVRSAKVAQMPVADFIAHVSRLGIAVVRPNASETTRDLETLDEWLASS